jgi:hypothetical protein
VEDSDSIDTRELTVDDIAVRCKLVEKPHRLLDILMRISQHREAIGAGWEFFIATLRRCTHVTTTHAFMMSCIRYFHFEGRYSLRTGP